MTREPDADQRDQMANRFDPAMAGTLDERSQELIARRRALLGPAYRLFYESPIEVTRAQGVYLYDRDGTEYLDAYNNVVSIGHCNPQVTAAISAQMAELCTHTRYLQGGILDFAERLLGTFESGLGHVMFTCTGSEANDLALRIAKHRTGREGVIITANAYHGTSALTAGLSPSLGDQAQLGPWVRCIPAPDSYHVQTDDMGAWLAAQLTDQIDALAKAGQKPAAFIADSLFTSDGIFPNDPGSLAAVQRVVRDAGALFIADEVQSGFARTGTHMWGYQRHGWEPDMVTLGKPMGNGYPVAGLVLRPEVVADFGRDLRYFNTFGGNTVAIAAAEATLRYIQSEGLQENAERMGRLFQDGLAALAGLDERIGDIRGAGLYLGVEIIDTAHAKRPNAALASAIVNGMRDRNVLISGTGPNANVLKIRPPLIFTEANIARFLAAFEATLKALP